MPDHERVLGCCWARLSSGPAALSRAVGTLARPVTFTSVTEPAPDRPVGDRKGTVALSHREVLLKSATGSGTLLVTLFALVRRP